MDGDPDRPLEAARESGLVEPSRPLLVLLSGGGDSVCLVDVAVRLGAGVAALHVNYGLREGAAEDEALCRELCERMGVPLAVERVELPAAGNLQERARDARYALAERHAEGDYAAAHTASDQAETVLYRLAASPGRRALLGMEPRRGRLVRPLLGATRADTRAYCRARGLDWREDPSNADRRFARARVRHDVLEPLRAVAPAVELTIAETARRLRDEEEVLERAAADALDALGGGPAMPLPELRKLPPALARLVLRRLAELAAGEPRSLSREEADAVLSLGGRGGTRSLDLGGGLRAVAEYGTLRLTRDPDAPPPGPVELPVPGSARFGDWEVEARLDRPGDVSVSADPLGTVARVRGWRDGDRIRPVGLGGTKSLQDLFTDRKVPRGLRRTLPVVEAAGGEIAWVAGVALDERFAAREGEPGAVGLSARRRT
jgi:tRNA(Ile)-lysidine synthase